MWIQSFGHGFFLECLSSSPKFGKMHHKLQVKVSSHFDVTSMVRTRSSTYEIRNAGLRSSRSSSSFYSGIAQKSPHPNGYRQAQSLNGFQSPLMILSGISEVICSSLGLHSCGQMCKKFLGLVFMTTLQAKIHGQFFKFLKFLGFLV